MSIELDQAAYVRFLESWVLAEKARSRRAKAAGEPPAIHSLVAMLGPDMVLDRIISFNTLASSPFTAALPDTRSLATSALRTAVQDAKPAQRHHL